MSLPLVSIVIPSYKASHFEACLKSAIGQTYPHIEIMVSDNCPTEAIKEICARYGSHVIYQRNPERGEQNVLTSLFCAKGRSEEHTSELQSLRHIVCRLLLEDKNASIS